MAANGDPALEEVSAAAVWLLAFSALCGVYAAWLPPSPEEIEACDAIVRIFFDVGGAWSLPLIGSLVALGWLSVTPPGRQQSWRAARLGLITAAGVALGLVLLRGLLGPTLPSFVPPEEGARPGFLLGLGAGVVEEALFRLMVLPGLFELSKLYLTRSAAALAAALGTGVLFALAHEAGPNPVAFDEMHFVVRALIPGTIFSLAAIRFGWVVPVAGHGFAHVLLPLLFD